MADPRSQIAQEIRSIRKRLAMTQAKLAAAIGVDAQTVARWERGERTPNADDYTKVKTLLGASSPRQSGISQPVPRGTPDLAESTWLPSHLHATARRFEIEMARLGATDEEVDHAEATLHSDHVAMLVNQRPDGSRRTPEETEVEFRLQMRALLRWLLMRMEFLGRKPQGDLVAIEEIVDPARRLSPDLFKPAPRRHRKADEN